MSNAKIPPGLKGGVAISLGAVLALLSAFHIVGALGVWDLPILPTEWNHGGKRLALYDLQPMWSRKRNPPPKSTTLRSLFTVRWTVLGRDLP